MRVLVVTNVFPSPELPASGIFVGMHVQALRAAGVEVEVLELSRVQSGRRVYWELGKRAREAAAKLDPSVVHVTYGGVMADVVTRGVTSAPIVVSFCGTDLLGGGAGGLAERLSLRYGVRASRRAATRAAGVIVMSPNLRAALPSRVPPENVWIVPYGIDFERFRPRDRASSRAALGWSPHARHVLFPAKASRPEKRFELARAGVDALRSTGVEVELHPLDGVPPDEVPTWMSAADAVVLTSLYEGSPNAVKEALACNTPVVSVDVGDVRELLGPIEGCHVAEPTPGHLAAKLEAALALPGPIDARRHVERFSLERVTPQVVEVFDTVARRRRDRDGR